MVLHYMDLQIEEPALSKNMPPIETKEQSVSILGVAISNLSKPEAINLIEYLVQNKSGVTRAIYIANAHTLNLAAESSHYHKTLNNAYKVFGDGTGVRWAARQRSVLMRDNLVGTDLIPELFAVTAGRGYRYFLLGGDSETIANAANTCRNQFPGWDLAGFHHGYLSKDKTAEAIRIINDSSPDMLLVGMGNPRQEQWIKDNRHELRVPVAIGVGGLFDHWAGNLNRAPSWVRQRGFEWLQLLLQQPHKWKRYLIGNPKFLARITSAAQQDRRVTWGDQPPQ
jgi:N-acetylglucosaminyldiphosphoundecaprenol N-acetyl-beta-D-mannosaminyltransferase